jgi:saccharopine dehydrogenase (NAD+, L-lysine-forming)
MIKIGVIREGKIPTDKRVPLTPEHVVQLVKGNKNFEVCIQASEIRCYPNSSYQDLGIEVKEDVADCDILLGVKEVPIPELIADKIYMFFSHTTKEQPYNRKLLSEILNKNITLIDYEGLTDQNGQRIVAFGRYAGIVGCYNGLLTYGKKQKLFNLRRAHECFDLDDLKTEYAKINLPPIKIVVTGGGRVTHGAMEVLDGIGIRKVKPVELLEQQFDEPVYAQLHSHHYNKHRTGAAFSDDDFHRHPEEFRPDFLKFAYQADILIAGAYWHLHAPVLFKKEDLIDSNFKIRVIADITCDIEGSIPTTLRSTSIDDPFYDYSVDTLSEAPPFSSKDNITIMAIDNLPNELPRNASQDFGDELINNVLPLFIEGDEEEILARATICKNGVLTGKYKYLESYVDSSIDSR